jgi:hypothetical protein
MENHLHEYYYDVIRSNLQPAEKLAKLNRYIAKLVRHSTTKPRRSLLDPTQKDVIDGETPTIYQVLRTKRRQDARHISHITDDTGVTNTTERVIAETFLTALRNKYRPIETEEAATKAIRRRWPPYQKTLTRRFSTNQSTPHNSNPQ